MAHRPIDEKLTQKPKAAVIAEHAACESVGTAPPADDDELFRTQGISGGTTGGDSHDRPYTIASKSIRAKRLPSSIDKTVTDEPRGSPEARVRGRDRL